jgi:uncharacterized membrane protein YbaN (DUF454 family)
MHIHPPPPRLTASTHFCLLYETTGLLLRTPDKYPNWHLTCKTAKRIIKIWLKKNQINKKSKFKNIE